MGHRLSKIVTRTGDGGTTGLGDGSRVSKASARIAAIGTVDELNSTIGVLLAEPLPDDVREALTDVQHDLFDLGGELAVPGYTAMSERHVERLEALVATHNAALAPLKEFVLPGGTRPAALAHVCRTVCRRAERAVVALALADRPTHEVPDGGVEASGVSAETPAAGAAPREMAGDPVRVYLNRLSDLLFVLARVLNRAEGRGDVLWTKGKNR